MFGSFRVFHAMAVVLLPAWAAAQAPVQIEVNAARVVHVMAGGAGASWHAMGQTAYWYKDMTRVNRNSRGSGWGGNPPLEYSDAWNDLRRHAAWLGLDFIRVEVSMRMYEPERGRFDWDSDEMRTLYRILDICQELHADVFLTQMWQDVEWNAFPAAGRLVSAPKSVPDFALGVGTLLEHLVKDRGYTSIRWFCMTNEPGMDWGWWNGADGHAAALMPALRAVRAELDRRGLSGVALSGPDWGLYDEHPEFDFADPAVGAHDAHDYAFTADAGMERVWAGRAHARGVPFFLSEFGSWAGGEPFTNPTTTSPASYANQLVDAEKVMDGLNAGVDGFNRWSFTNRGDLDGAWQLVRTFDPQKWDYLKRVAPEPVPYYCYGILTRFMASHSAVLETKTQAPLIAAVALRSPRGNLTVYVLNRGGAAKQLRVAVAGIEGARVLYKYQVMEWTVGVPGYQMNPMRSFAVSPEKPEFSDQAPGESITVYSTYKLTDADPGIAGE
ncbi:MAG: cellulase family glycosylhydrolase [Bryobacteraceae bacterium]